MNEKELANAIKELRKVHKYLPDALKENALDYLDKFKANKLIEFDLTFIEWMVETGYARREKGEKE